MRSGRRLGGRSPAACRPTPRSGEQRSVGGWALRSNIPASAYQAWVTAEANAGRKLTYVDAYVRGRVTTFSAITTSRSTLRLARHGLDGKQLQSEFDAALRRGWRTLGITGYPTSSGVRYAALWG